MFKMIGQFDDHLETASSLISATSEQSHILLALSKDPLKGLIHRNSDNRLSARRSS